MDLMMRDTIAACATAPGAAGIAIVRMSGPRAEEILKQLEESRARREEKGEEVHIEKPKDDSYQLSFINLDDPLLLEVKETIVGLDINSLTPVEALMKLNEIQGLLTGKKK